MAKVILLFFIVFVIPCFCVELFPGICKKTREEVDCSKVLVDINPFRTDVDVSEIQRMKLRGVRVWKMKPTQLPKLKTLVITLSPSISCELFDEFLTTYIILNGEKCEKSSTSSLPSTTLDLENSSFPEFRTRRPPFIFFNISMNSTNTTDHWEMYLELQGIEPRVAVYVVGAVCIALVILGCLTWLYHTQCIVRCRIMLCCDKLRRREVSKESLTSDVVYMSTPLMVENLPMRELQQSHIHNE